MPELVIALVVAAILGAVVISTFGGQREAARNRAAAVVATTYAQAITAFMADNQNRVPQLQDMYSPTSSGPTDVKYGPRNLVGKPYTRNIPDAVVNGSVQVCMAGNGTPNWGPDYPQSCPDTPALARIVYQPDTAEPISFTIRVVTRRRASDSWPALTDAYCVAGLRDTSNDATRAC
jgi:type II secretory pathway pseudopilin PulG